MTVFIVSYLSIAGPKKNFTDTVCAFYQTGGITATQRDRFSLEKMKTRFCLRRFIKLDFPTETNFCWSEVSHG